MILIILFFSIPAVQTKTAERLTGLLNENFGTEIHIDKIQITYDAKVKAKGVFIGDHHGDTLISSQSLTTHLTNFRALVKGENINFGDVTARNLTFRLRRYEGDEKDSFGIFLDKLESQDPKEELGPQIIFSHLTVIDSKFSFYDEQAKYPDIISLTDLNIDASNFIIHGPHIKVKINALNAKERRGVQIENLSTGFVLNDDEMNFEEFQLLTQHSEVSADIFFSYEETMADFENTVQVFADFKNSLVSTSDLRFYFDEFGMGQDLNFHGKMTGVLNDFELSDFKLDGINQTHIDGNINLKNIFEDEGFIVSGQFNNLETNYYDLINLLPNILTNPLPQNLKQLGQTKLKGSLSTTGFMVSTNSEVFTKIGRAKLDASLSNLGSQGNETYNGKVKVENFDLGDFLNNPQLGKASFAMNMQGKGFDRKNLNSELKGVFTHLEFNGYTYRKIAVNGHFKDPIFSGEIISDDPNLDMTFNGSADVSGKENNFDFIAQVNHMNLRALNFMKKDSISLFSGKVDLQMQGNNLDDVVGNINLNDAVYENQKGIYEFENLNLQSSFENDIRKINVHSPDIIHGELRGRFVLGEVDKLFRNAIGNLYANYKPFKIMENQFMNFDVSIHSKVVEALLPNVNLSSGTTIKGEVRSSNSNVKIAFKSPEIQVYDNTFKNINLQLDNTNPLFATYFDVDSISTSFYNFSKTKIVSNRRNDTLYVRTNLKGGKENKDEYNVNLFYTINEKSESVIGIRPSTVTFRETQWALNQENKKSTIVFDNAFKNLQTDSLEMRYEDQVITFTGSKSGKDEKNLELNFINVDFDKITPSLQDFSFEGIMNGKLEVHQQKGVYYPSSDLRIANLKVNDIDYGNLETNIKGNQSLTSYSVSAKLKGKKTDYLSAIGEIDVDEVNPRIHVDVDFDQFKIDLLNIFGENVISDIRGTATGQATVAGNYKRPSISGELKLNKAGMGIPYLNVDMVFAEDASVKLSDQAFYFDHVDFKDSKYQTEAQVDGSITHNNFMDWGMDLRLRAPERLLALDTEYTEEALYYGKAFISGNARFHGPFDELIIDVDATSEKGTVFKIPLSDAETIAESNFVYFLTPEDKEARKKGEDIIVSKIKGLQLNFDLDVTDDADIEVVIDKKSGSTLRGKGVGTILMEINTIGKFNMWGDFVAYSGVYNFKYGGIIEKEFGVVPGGTLTWDGNPVQANLNVRALYETAANPATILENPTVNRPIPVNVFIELTGLLSNVDINFELEYPNLSSVVKSELEYRINDRETTEIQAMSLIAQRSFYSDFGAGRTTHPENLLYERAAGLFNDIFSGEEDIFKVGVNYTKGNRTPDQDYSDRVGVTLSTNVSDRILINGKVGVPVGGYTRSVVVGDVEMEILLNDDGTLRAKLFNRESDIQYIGEELGYTQGVGLSYSVDFNTFREFIRKILNKQMIMADIPRRLERDKKESLVPEYIHFPGN